MEIEQGKLKPFYSNNTFINTFLILSYLDHFRLVKIPRSELVITLKPGKNQRETHFIVRVVNLVVETTDIRCAPPLSSILMLAGDRLADVVVHDIVVEVLTVQHGAELVQEVGRNHDVHRATLGIPYFGPKVDLDFVIQKRKKKISIKLF